MFANPRTMERVGFPLASYVTVSRRPPSDCEGLAPSPLRVPTLHSGADGGAGLGASARVEAATDTDGVDGPGPGGRDEVVGCFTVWPSTELKSRQLVLPRALAVGPLSVLHPGAPIWVSRITPVAAAAITVHLDVTASTVSRSSSMHVSNAADVRFAAGLLRQRCVVVGVSVTGTRMGVAITARVVATEATSPAGTDPSVAVIVTDSTEIRVEPSVPDGGASQAAREDKSAYEAIGGLGPQLDAIRDMIELPLRRPGLFAHFGVRPPGGVLLVGPPGTGKTLIARACAAASGAHTIVVNGPEVISKFYGEVSEPARSALRLHARAPRVCLRASVHCVRVSVRVRVRDSLLNLSPRIPSPLSSGSVQTERRLREIFSEARRRAPALIFIDEIDALCPSRERAPNDLEKRIVATMLTLMDGANTPTAATAQSGHVLVIGATNRPDALDPAIRRPGRFDREIEIGIPNATGRREILDALLRNTPHSIPAGAVGQVAAVTHGYVGADLAAVCNEAGMLAARRAIQSTKAGGSAVPAAITEPDLRAGLQRVRPSAMREVYVDVPTVRWTDIGGQDGAKQELREAVEWPLKHPEAFTRMGIRAPRGILLYGPPGCSKTLMAKALATESSLNFLAVKGPEVFSKWVGESEKAVQAVFRKARAVAPSIVFFDEIDAIAGQRQEDGGGGGVGDRVLSQLLSEMDGVEALHNVTVVAATNRPDIIDTALLRPGRIDRMVYVGPPDRAAREQILTRNLRDVPCADSVDVAALAVATDGCSGAEVVAVCREGALQAMKEDPADAAVVEHRHFVSAVAGLNRTITAEMLAFYDNYRAASR